MRTKFLSKFLIISKLLPLDVAHTYKNFVEQNSKAPLYQSMELLGVPYVKRGDTMV